MAFNKLTWLTLVCLCRCFSVCLCSTPFFCPTVVFFWHLLQEHARAGRPVRLRGGGRAAGGEARKETGEDAWRRATETGSVVSRVIHTRRTLVFSLRLVGGVGRREPLLGAMSHAAGSPTTTPAPSWTAPPRWRMKTRGNTRESSALACRNTPRKCLLAWVSAFFCSSLYCSKHCHRLQSKWASDFSLFPRRLSLRHVTRRVMVFQAIRATGL